MDTISAAATLSAWGEARDGSLPGGDRPASPRHRPPAGEGDLLAEGSGGGGVPRETVGIDVGQVARASRLRPRGPTGWRWPTSPAPGGCHLRAYPISHEILRKPVASDGSPSRGRADDKDRGRRERGGGLLVACKFAFFGASLEEYASCSRGDGEPATRRTEGDRGTDLPHGAVLQLPERLHAGRRRLAGPLLHRGRLLRRGDRRTPIDRARFGRS